MNAPNLIERADKPKTWKRWLPLIGLAVLAWIISSLDRAALVEAFGRVTAQTALMAAASFSINLIIKGVRWQRLSRAQGLTLPMPVAMAAFMAGQFYGQVTVGRLGEFYRAEALTERGVPAATALSSCFYDRVLDLAMVLGLGAVLGAFVVGNMQAALAALALLVMGGLVLLLLVFPGALPGGLRALIGKLLARVERIGPAAKILRFATELLTGMRPMMRPAVALEAMCWTVLGWAGYFGALWILAAGISMGVSRAILTAGASLAALSALLPVTISGLGARELIFKELLSLEGASEEASVALALMHLAIMSGSAILMGLVGVVVRQRQRRALARARA